MGTKQASNKYIGKKATYRVGSLTVEVNIKDHRAVFGRDDVLISPVTGDGQQWVSADSVVVAE
jgi:hypothetical protein